MRRSVLALLALLPAASVVSPAPASPSMPTDRVVYRPECFGHVAEEAKATSAPVTVGSTGSGRNTRSPAKSGGKSAPATAAPPPPPAAPAQQAPGDPNLAGGAYGGGGDASRSPVLSKEFLQSVPTGRSYQSGVALAEEAEAAPAADAALAAAKAKKEQKDDAKPAEPVGGEMERLDDRDRAAAGPVLDWGGTVWLSNDDSMSLASAQRLLYAVSRGVGFSIAEIRPHELLNYFSFDTVTPDADQVFDVLASAQQDGDQLTVALSVKGATPQRQPLDLTLLVDRSCSMEGEGRMGYTQRGLRTMADNLESGDRVDLVLFDDRVCVPLENFVVGRDDPSLLQRTIDQMRPEGSTDVDLGLREAYRVAKSHTGTQGRNRRMMLVTDALMNTGDVNPDTVSEIGKAFETDGIRLTGVGVGSEFNDEVLNRLTEKGKGAYVFLGSEAVVDRLFGPAGFASLTETIAHDVHFRLELPDSLAMERFYGEEASTTKEDVQPIHYYAGTSQLFLQDLRLKNGRIVADDPVELVIEYRDARTGEPETRSFRTTVGKMVKADPHNARKGLALMAWTDLLTAEAMGADPCGDPLRDYARRAGPLADDAEIGFVNGLVRSRCGSFDLPTVVTDHGVPFKVKVDADIPITTVALDCGGARSTESLTGSDVIAMFTAPSGGVCELTLSGTVDMRAEVEVPSTGGDLRCVVRGGRVACS